MTTTAKITSKGQVTIPKEVREALEVHEGSVVLFEKDGDKIVLKPAKTLKEFKGILKSKQRVMDFNQIRKIVKKSIAKRVFWSGRH